MTRPAPSMFSKEQAPFTCAAATLMSLQPVLVTLSKNKVCAQAPCARDAAEVLPLPDDALTGILLSCDAAEWWL